MKFRFHRGGFTESMATAVEVNSMAELQAHIQSQYADANIPPTNIRIEFYHPNDPRSGWGETWLVVGTFGVNGDIPIGMSNAGSFD